MSLFCQLERIFSLLRVGIEVKRGVYSPKSTSLGKANRPNSSVCVCVCVCTRSFDEGQRGMGAFAYVLLLKKKNSAVFFPVSSGWSEDQMT